MPVAFAAAMPDDPTTQELRLSQLRREQAERELAERLPEEDGAEKHERRADRAAYLREKLEQRAESERELEEDG